MKKVIRVILIEGEDEWVDTTLEHSVVNMEHPVYQAGSRGKLTQIFSGETVHFKSIEVYGELHDKD